MNTEQVHKILTPKFLLELVWLKNFEATKDSTTMKVMCVEDKRTVERNYVLHFSNVIAFDFWKAPLWLTDGDLDVDIDDIQIKPFKDVEKYKNLEFHPELAELVENPDEYWCLDFTCAVFQLSVVFEHITMKQV